MLVAVPRAVALVLALAACGGHQAPPPQYPSLDVASPPLPPAAAAPDLATFAPPPSSPSGPPIVITWRPPVVGDTVVRDDTEDSLYTSRWDDRERRQRTTGSRRVIETVREIDGAWPRVLDLEVIRGDETVDLDGERHHDVLLSGRYRLAADRDGHLTVSRNDTGYPVGDREREELEAQYAGSLAVRPSWRTLLERYPLRVGETVALDAEDRAALGGADTGGELALTLTAVDGGLARYALSFVHRSTDDGRETLVAMRVTLVVEVATGRLRERLVREGKAETGPGMSDVSSHEYLARWTDR